MRIKRKKKKLKKEKVFKRGKKLNKIDKDVSQCKTNIFIHSIMNHCIKKKNS